MNLRVVFVVVTTFYTKFPLLSSLFSCVALHMIIFPPVEEIPEAKVPLVQVPKTGDGSGLWSAMALLSACGLAVLSLFKKNEE